MFHDHSFRRPAILLATGVLLLVVRTGSSRADDFSPMDAGMAETTASEASDWFAQAPTKLAPLSLKPDAAPRPKPPRVTAPATPTPATPSQPTPSTSPAPSRPTPPPPTAPSRPTPPLDAGYLAAAATPTAWAGERLAGMPNMFGDVFNLGGNLSVMKGTITAEGDLPLAAACRRVKVAENNSALPQDRVYFLYNHFHNSLQTEVDQSLPAAVLDQRDFSVNRYTIGLEKTLFQGLWSVELRMPFGEQIDYLSPSFDAGGGDMVAFGVSGGEVGNLAVLLKRLIYESNTAAMSVGLGIDTPTGNDAHGYFDTHTYTLENQAVHLLPYVGVAWAPRERLFFHSFLQVDVPTNGNRVDYSDPAIGEGTFGVLDEQTLLYVDVAAGYWLYRNRRAPTLTGLAAVVEIHDTTTLQDADSVSGMVGLATFGNPANRVDVTNLTVGIHTEFANHTLFRVGGVFPLSSGDNRWFDAEVQAQVERRF